MPETTPTKDDLLAAIVVERRYWDTLVATVERAGLMDRSGTNNGSWTFKEMAAHLNAWRGMTVARLEAARRGAGPPAHAWPAGLEEGRDIDAINAWFAARDKDRPATEILAESAAQFDAMGAAVAAMPPDDLLTPGRFAWLGDLPIGPAVLGYSFTHLHTDHEPDIRAWLRRETGSEPVLPPATTTFGYEE
ncbi:MAG: ClbS/DfsB family four-helix bundle protein [Thermomicrobia bacterium]|nr:ClbS/DfsB family four-helix bundle protein [Thermomicrobia bacterium]MCA1723565.1 ClbS/DfsB family four-helix bundle protein [Thermomicrobia bacterium]